MTAGVILAKKKSSTGKTPVPDEPVSEDRSRSERSGYLKFRVSGVFKDWFERFADSERSDMSDLFDDCVVAYAKARGFEPPPKR